jgi:hypothetical protein
MTFAPEAFILGAAKCATTTLADLLDLHPEIRLSDPKEPDFFTGRTGCSAAWYRDRFGFGRETIRIDASTSYGAAPPDGPAGGVPRAIAAARPDARLVFVLRDPVARAWSSYWHEVRAGTERRPFAAALRDPLSVHRRAGLYAARLGEVLEVFAPERLLLLDFEDLRRDPVAAARRTAAFLGVDPAGLEGAAAQRSNEGYVYAGPGRLLRGTVGNEGIRKLNALARRIAPGLSAVAKSLIARPLPRIGPEDAARARDLFARDAEATARDHGVETRTGPWWSAPHGFACGRARPWPPIAPNRPTMSGTPASPGDRLVAAPRHGADGGPWAC